jgi:myo-inositol-hexaphosphate 3-phosphohydrolase
MMVSPNPFVDNVSITFEVTETTNATLTVYDLVGRSLITIVDGQIPNGKYTYQKDLGFLDSGVYIVKLSVENGTPSFERIIKQK